MVDGCTTYPLFLYLCPRMRDNLRRGTQRTVVQGMQLSRSLVHYSSVREIFFFLLHLTDRAMSKQLINCDWLQFYANHHGLTPSEADRGTNFKLVDLKHGTRVFKDVYQVFERAKCTKSHRDELLATIALHPSSSIMRPNLCIVKIENKVLYGEQRYNRIATMIAQLQLEYCGITRADICVDLHTFANNLHPLALLRGYRKNDYIKRGSRRYSQWLTAPYSPSQVQGVFTYDIRSEEHVTHCVSWGGAQSDVHVKMYNKTKEIREESGKQYISAWWRRNGLDNSQDVLKSPYSAALATCVMCRMMLCCPSTLTCCSIMAFSLKSSQALPIGISRSVLLR